MMKRLLLNGSVALLGIMLSLVIGEIALRMFYRDRIVLFPRYHTCAQYGDFLIRKIRPNTTFIHSSINGTYAFKTNNKGFRNDRDIEYQKAEGTIRILVLGDSHTQGYEVNQHETFSYVCERYLTNKGIKAEVINAGVCGFGTAEELVFLENEGYRYKPDYVVLGFFANDPEDNIKSGIFKLENGRLLIVKKNHLPGVEIQDKIYSYPLVKYLSEHSYLYSLIFNTVWEYYKKRLLEQGEDLIVTEYALPQGKISDYEITLTMKIIERMYDFCKNNGMKFIIVDIPQYNPEGRCPVKPSIPPDCLQTVRTNCDFLFSTDDLNEEYKRMKHTHVVRGQRHISPETHTLLGEKIGEYILESKGTPLR